jgi:hypothetical protein
VPRCGVWKLLRMVRRGLVSLFATPSHDVVQVDVNLTRRTLAHSFQRTLRPENTPSLSSLSEK